MNKKTGILTLSAAENYGAVLQCHSLCCYIKENFMDCEIIDFTPSFIIGRYPLCNIKHDTFIHFLKSVVRSTIEYHSKRKRKNAFISFRKNDSFYSEKSYVKDMTSDDYDFYVVGSDQVFNLALTGFEQEFFLPHITDSKKKIIYAASLGVSELSAKEKMFFKNNLNDFQYISIREKTGCDLIKTILPEKNIIQLIDPVFLHDDIFWEKLCSNRICNKEYILIYTFSDFEKAYKIARYIDRNMKILVINDSCTPANDDVEYVRGVGPKEFLSLVKYSSYVITDSFHGTAFSIIFKREFYAIPFKGTSSRFKDMLNAIGLSNRLVEEEVKCSDSLIDYKKIDTNIENCRRKSWKYFKEVYGEHSCNS